MEVLAYAKINLVLEVLGKRRDGYHDLDMVMHSITLADRIRLEKRNGGGIVLLCDRKDVPVGEENTVLRAARVFLEETGLRGESLLIELSKTIPSQAGLGGGSADAAAVLHALNRLYGLSLAEKELCRMGLRVGADVPFCVAGGSRRVRGVGEKLTALPLLPDCFLVVCKPQENVSTAKAYARIDAFPRPAGQLRSGAMAQALGSGDLDRIGGSLENAFEAALDLPGVRAVKAAMLAAGSCGAGMTGSGSAVFGLFRHSGQAQACAGELNSRGLQAFLCRPAAAPLKFLE